MLDCCLLGGSGSSGSSGVCRGMGVVLLSSAKIGWVGLGLL